MSKKKMMHFIHGLSTGGAETLVKDYMINFDKEKFDMVLLCVSHAKESPYEKILADNNINVIFVEDYLWFRGRTGVFAKFVNHFQRYFVVRKILRERAPDILHTHLRLNRFVKFARPSRKTKIFHTVHNEPTVLWRKNDRKRQKDLYAVKWLVMEYGMRFIVLHEQMREEINRMFGVQNTVVLNNGIPVEKYIEKKDCLAIRRGLEIPEDSFVVGHVGRFSVQKNHEFLIKVFAEIKKKNDKAFLLMVGDGEDKKEVESKLKDLGLKDDYLILSNRNDVPDLLATMDVFVFPSRYEGVSVALIEVQEAKKPCFISDTISDHTIISNLITKMSINDDAKKWADAILSYKKPKEVIINDEEWDIKKITKKLEQIYLEALAEKQNGKK